MQTRQTVDSVNAASADVTAELVARLQAAIPEYFVEGELDTERLLTMLGRTSDERPERYTFTWAGKRDAIRLLQTPTRATLVPAKDESVNWDTTQNLFIEGDNLEVLKLLYKAYYGRVKMIYIDPPYNTGRDFIYPDNFADPLEPYLELTGQVTADGNRVSSLTEKSGRFHSAWLNMLYPRLFVARQLLKDDGVMFVSIADHEIHNLRVMLNEIFGEENFVAVIIWQKVYSPKSSARHFSEDHDYILVYARNADVWRPNLLPRTEDMNARYTNPDGDPRGPWKPGGLDARNYYSKGIYPINCPSGRVIPGPPSGSYWRYSHEKFLELVADNRIWFGDDGNSVPSIKRFLSEVKQGRVPQTLWTYQEVGHTQEAKQELLQYVVFEDTDNVLDTVKPTRLVERMLQLGTSDEDNNIVLDFFAGSATTAHALIRRNCEDNGRRQFIVVQVPERLQKIETHLQTIADIGKQRIRQAISRDPTIQSCDSSDKEFLGFRVFKLSPSHFTNWSGTDSATPADYHRQLEAFTDPLTQRHDAEAVIWEVAIKEGYSLTSQVEAAAVAGHMVYRVSDPDRGQHFHICLDDDVAPELAAALELGKEDLFVCRDLALDDSAAANLALQCRLKTI